MQQGRARFQYVTKRSVALTWVVLFVLALALPAIHFNQVESKDPQDIWRGWEVLLLGWLGLFYMQPAWLANLLIVPLFTCFWFRKWRACVILSAIATGLAITSFSCVGLYLPRDEGGVQHLRVAQLDMGFYLWVSSFAVWMAALANVGKRRKRAVQVAPVTDDVGA